MNMTRMLDLHFTLFIITTVASFLPRETVVVEAASCEQDFSLKIAYCADHGLRSVPIDLLPDLRNLYLHDNFLTEIENKTFKRYPNLRVLTLDNNNISRMEDGSFYPLQNLVHLAIAENPYLPSLKRSMFQTDSLAYLNAHSSNLETFSGDLVACLAEGAILSLPGNKLRKINWTSSNPLNSIVYLGTNRFQFISTSLFVFNNYADTLDLSGNPIEFIEATAISSLHVKAISLRNTRIAFPQLSNLFHGIRLSRFIKEFDLSGDKLDTIENGFFAPLKGKKLDKLAVESNSLGVIYEDGLYGLDRVTQLLLGGNNLEKIEPYMFDGMVALRSLSLDQNGMITLNSQATSWNLSLVNLNLARNKLRALNSSTFLGLNTLNKLDLSDNFKLQVIKNDTFVHLQSLTELDLSKTHILDQTFPYLPRVLATLILESTYLPSSWIRPGNLGTEAPSLATLHLIHNDLGAVHMWDANNNKSSFSGLKNLSRLELSNNPLFFLPLGFFKNLSNLQLLRLDKCSLTGLEIGMFADLDNLVLLSMENNYLTIIPSGVFDKLHNLRYLFLLGNTLTHLDSNLFKYLSSLVSLDVSENRLSSLNLSTFEPLKALTRLDLSFNQFICNCDLKWLPGWLKGSVELIDSVHATCIDSTVTLEPFRNKQLITFDPVDECGPNIILYSCLAIAGMALILALGLAYYQRWWIRYRLFLLKLCFIGYEELHDDVERGEFRYDLAIMHHETDNDWVNENLRPTLAERVPDYDRIVCGDEELMLGMHYLDAVHYAAEQSFKTIFVISREALLDQWFILKFRTVLDHINDVTTEKMILVFTEDIPGDELPFLIRLFLSGHRTYLVWPDNERGQGYFWEELIKNLTVNIRCNHLIPPD